MSLIFKKSTAQPAFTVAAAITGTTEATQTLTCAYTVVRARAANVTVRWYRHTADDGADPTGVLLGTGSTYTLTGTDVGHYIRAIVTAINPAGTVQSTTSYTAIITAGDQPEPPALVASAVITGTADVGETLTVTYSFTGQDSVAIQWYSYATEPTGSPLAGTDEVTLGTASTQALTESESGRWIVAVVTATNAVDSTVTSASVAMAGVDPYAPIAPAQYTVPAYDDSVFNGEDIIYAYAGDDLQAKLNLLRPGKCLVLEAGATWTGKYVVTDDYLGATARAALESAEDPTFDQWAYIITSDMVGLPAEGTRVTANDVSHMPKIQYGTQLYPGSTWNTATGISKVGTSLTLTHAAISSSYLIPVGGSAELRNANEPEYNTGFIVTARTTTSITMTVPEAWSAPTGPVQFAYIISQGATGDPGALRVYRGVSKLRIVGLELTTQYTYQNTIERAILSAGNYGGSGTGNDLIVERCYVHGTPTGKCGDGIVLGAGVRGIAVKDCTIDYLSGAATESHGIHVQNSPGPTLIHNNTIIAAGINVFLRDNSEVPPHPEDVTITKNYIAMRAEWDPVDPTYDGTPHLHKNLIESKGTKRLLVRGNVFHRAWGDGSQMGSPLFIQNVGGEGVWDVDFRDNLCVSCGSMRAANPFDNGRVFGWQRFRILNNLFADFRKTWAQISIGNAGTGFQRYLTVRHNTFIAYSHSLPEALLYFNASWPVASGIDYADISDNIFRQSRQSIGVGANNLASGRTAAAYHMSNFDFNKNVSVGESFSQYSTTFADWRNWKSGNTGGIWGNSNVGYVSTEFTELGHFALSGSSQFKNNGSDGTDIGCDIAALAAQINASDNPFGA